MIPFEQYKEQETTASSRVFAWLFPLLRHIRSTCFLLGLKRRRAIFKPMDLKHATINIVAPDHCCMTREAAVMLSSEHK